MCFFLFCFCFADLLFFTFLFVSLYFCSSPLNQKLAKIFSKNFVFFIQIGMGRNHLVAAAAAKLKLFQVSFRFIRSQRSEISLQIEKKLPYHRISSNAFWRLSCNGRIKLVSRVFRDPSLVSFLSNQSLSGLSHEASALSSPSRIKLDSNLVRNDLALGHQDFNLVPVTCCGPTHCFGIKIGFFPFWLAGKKNPGRALICW